MSPEPESPLALASPTRIGWIGTGVMGASMCGHFLSHGYQVTVYTRSRMKAESLVKAGASWAESLMICRWPEADGAQFDSEAEGDMTLLMDLIRQIRNARAEFNVTPGKRVPAIVVGGTKLAMLRD